MNRNTDVVNLSASKALTTLFVALISVGSLASPAQAQVARGVVANRGAAVSGVVVQLLDSTSTVVARGLSDEKGAYRVLAPRAGTYRLIARRIGFAALQSPPFTLGVGETRAQPLSIEGLSVALDTVRVVATADRCPKVVGDQTDGAFQWEQARTALMATEATLANREMRATLLNFRRTRYADGQSELDALSTVSVDSVVQPWRSLSARELMRAGYVGKDRDATVYRAPDLDVLISNEFAESNCFRIVTASDSNILVVSFDPARPRRGISELRGTVSLDRQSLSLRALDFSYTNIPQPISQAGAGGRMEFVPLHDGSWMIGRWQIVMPVLSQTAQGRLTLLALVPKITRTEIVGGQPLAALRGADTLYSRKHPSVTGVVIDSTSGVPIPGATLTVSETGTVAVAQSSGNFELSTVAPGAYRLMIHTPSLDSIGAVTSVPLTVADMTASLVLRVPNANKIFPVVCPPRGSFPSDPDVQSVLRGTVHRALQAPSAPTEVLVQWTDAKSGEIRSRRVDVDEAGDYQICGLPIETGIDVRAESATLTGSSRVEIAASAPFRRLDLTLESLAPRAAVIRGDVRDSSGYPLNNATLEIAGLSLTAVSDDKGRFRIANVPAGKQHLLARRLGFAVTGATIDVAEGALVDQHVTLHRVTTLGEITTIANRARLREFDEHRRIGLGQFRTREELAKQEGLRLSSLLSMMRATKLIPMGMTGAMFKSSRAKTSLTGSACFAQIWVDGVPYYSARKNELVPNINDFLVSQIEALEYYASPAETPAKYSSLNSACGVLIIHTR